MSSPKTRPGEVTVESYLDTLADKRRVEAEQLIEIMERVSGASPVMWGTSIVGFGSYQDAKGSEWPRIAFSARKTRLSLYRTNDAQQYIPELNTMGKYSLGKGCIYINNLDDVDQGKLQELCAITYEKSELC